MATVAQSPARPRGQPLAPNGAPRFDRRGRAGVWPRRDGTKGRLVTRRLARRLLGAPRLDRVHERRLGQPCRTRVRARRPRPGRLGVRLAAAAQPTDGGVDHGFPCCRRLLLGVPRRSCAPPRTARTRSHSTSTPRSSSGEESIPTRSRSCHRCSSSTFHRSTTPTCSTEARSTSSRTPPSHSSPTYRHCGSAFEHKPLCSLTSPSGQSRSSSSGDSYHDRSPGRRASRSASSHTPTSSSEESPTPSFSRSCSSRCGGGIDMPTSTRASSRAGSHRWPSAWQCR